MTLPPPARTRAKSRYIVSACRENRASPEIKHGDVIVCATTARGLRRMGARHPQGDAGGWVRDTEGEEPRCPRQSRERKRAVAGTSSEIAGCDPSPPLSYVRGSARSAPTLGFSRFADASRKLPLLRRAPGDILRFDTPFSVLLA